MFMNIGNSALRHVKSDEEDNLRDPDNEEEEKIMATVAKSAEELDLQWVDMSSLATSTFLCTCLRYRVAGLGCISRIALGGASLGDEGAAAVVRTLSELARFGGIDSIDLFFNQMTAVGVRAITEILVQWGAFGPAHLGLSWNDFGDSGVRELLPLLLPTTPVALASLSLAHCLITQDGGSLVADALTDNMRIVSLNVAGNAMLGGTAKLIQSCMKPPVGNVRPDEPPLETPEVGE